ncbi:serine hydrolase domain-containing protein [Colwelliaceae bacterium BS250]
MFKIFSILLLLILSPSLAAKTYDLKAARDVLNEYIKTGKLAGGVILVMKDGEKILHYAAGMQDVESGKPMNKDSLFRIASQTKALTTVSVMILKERGLLKLTDPVSKYIPAFKKTTVLTINKDESRKIEPASREITIHDLMTHSSGISYGWGPNHKQWKKAGLLGGFFSDRDQTMAQVLAPIPSLPHKAQPGTQYVYGYNTDLLGVIIKIVSGKSLKDFFESEITGPLKMIDTHFYLPLDKADRLATVYNVTPSGLERAEDGSSARATYLSQGNYVHAPHKAFSGGGGLISTTDDYAVFLSMLENNGSLNGVTILSPASVAEMTQDQIPYIDTNWDGYGFGFTLEIADAGADKGKTTEYGWGGAFHTSYYVRPEDNVVVVYMTQLTQHKKLKDWEEINAAIKMGLGIKP